VQLLDYTIRLAVSLLPVVLFLLTLIYLDSYKLMHLRLLLATLLAGCVMAVASLVANGLLVDVVGVGAGGYRRYGAPFVEEALKGAWVVWLIARKRVGFMVDAAIVGFGVGAGFAIVENTWYIGSLETNNILVWAVRGFGTAVMHGGTAAVFAIISKNLHDRSYDHNYAVYLPGWLVAAVIHSVYNHFLLSPVLSTVVLYVTLPVIIIGVFYRSERGTREWLGAQLDVDAELLEMIHTGRIGETRVGRYFRTVREQFPPEMVVDMVCYLRLHVELAVSAKGILMMREAGFQPKPPPGTEERLRELDHLERTIGTTGRLALKPFLHASNKDLWQLYMLGK
jgi:RsiW-degrading membrane proteinase PrsW (M82 family)